MTDERATSTITGVLLMVVICLIMAALLLLMFMELPYFWSEPEIPTIFEITNIRHTSEEGAPNFDSYLVLTNIGDRGYDNRKLYARTYRNGVLLPVMIPIMNGNRFIKIHPYGIERLGGPGSYDFHWYPGAIIYIDYTDRTFRPGDIVQFEVYDKDTNQILSRDTWPHQDRKTKKLLDLLFSHRGV